MCPGLWEDLLMELQKGELHPDCQDNGGQGWGPAYTGLGPEDSGWAIQVCFGRTVSTSPPRNWGRKEGGWGPKTGFLATYVGRGLGSLRFGQVGNCDTFVPVGRQSWGTHTGGLCPLLSPPSLMLPFHSSALGHLGESAGLPSLCIIGWNAAEHGSLSSFSSSPPPSVTPPFPSPLSFPLVKIWRDFI